MAALVLCIWRGTPAGHECNLQLLQPLLLFLAQVFICARNEQDVAATVAELMSNGHRAQVKTT